MQVFIEPFELAFQQRALAGGALAAVALAVIGTWVIIRGMTFLGDALVHGVIPGIALAVLFDFNVLIGAALAAAVMIGGINLVHRQTSFSEDTGIGLLFVALTVSMTAIFRNLLKMEYKRWRLLHRLGASAVFLILPFHVLFVSDTFKSTGLPRSAAITIFSLNLLFIAYIWLKRFFKK